MEFIFSAHKLNIAIILNVNYFLLFGRHQLQTGAGGVEGCKRAAARLIPTFDTLPIIQQLCIYQFL
jgi:hypothetical protein